MELPFDFWPFEFVSPIDLMTEPQHADMLLLRRVGAECKDDQALVLRALWPRLGRVTIVEYKSPVDSYRPGDLVRLVTCGCMYEADHLSTICRSEGTSRWCWWSRPSRPRCWRTSRAGAGR